MKIALIFPKDSEAIFNKHVNRSFGGATVQMYTIAKELVKRNKFKTKTFSLIPYYNKIHFMDEDIFNLIKIYNGKTNLFKKIYSFNKTLKKLKPDFLIQRGLTFFSCFLAKYCKLHNMKFVFMFAHDKEVTGKYQENGKKCKFFKMLLKNASLILTQNQYQQKTLKEKFNTTSEILNNSIEIDQKYNPNNNEEILWVSRCNEWKRPELFIELALKNPNFNFKMVCSKIKNKENYFNKIKKKADEVENLVFFNFLNKEKISEYYKEAHLLVNTSVAEGFPNTFLEAGLYSTPLLSLNVNPNNFITEYNCGVFCNGDLNLMNEELKKIRADKDLFMRYSKNVYSYVKDNHSVENNVARLLDLLEDIK